MLAFAAFLLLFADDSGASLERALKNFVEVFATVEDERRRSDQPVAAPSYEGAIPGMLRRLDPFSVFFDPGQFEQLQAARKIHAQRVRHVVSILPGRVIVLQTLPGTPSASRA